MSPTGVAALFLLALMVDYAAFLPTALGDRLAFCLALVAIRVGFNDSQLDKWTVERLEAFIDFAKDAAGDAYIANAVTSQVLGIFVGILFFYVVGCMVPDRFSSRLGRYATLGFPPGKPRSINYKLWLCAFGLGLMGELPNGWIGDLTMFFIGLFTAICTPLPNLIFGVS